MAVDMTIKVSAKDNYSDAITTMRKANQNFTKDLTGLQSKLDALNKTKYVLKGDTKKIRNELVSAEKQYEKNKTAANKLAVEMAHAKYENANRNLRLVSQNSIQAEKDMLGLADAAGKTEGVWKSIGSSGAISKVGDVLQKVAGTQVGSAQGQEAGITASSMVSAAAMGASIGTAIAPGIGTAIGALGGAVLGYIQGQNAIFENKDNAFKSYYQNLYNGVLGAQNQTLARGIGIASRRGADKIPFSTLLGGDENANEFLDSLVDFAAGTPFAYEELANISKDLLTFGYKQEELLPLLEKVGDTGAALGMKPEDMKSLAVALSHMQVTGETTMQDLNSLLEQRIDVWSYLTDLSETSGKTKEQIKEMVSEGLIPGEKAAEAIKKHMGADYGGNMQQQMKTYSGLISSLGDAQAEIDNAMGEGYISTREKGRQDQIDFLSGENGEEMQEAYKKIGQWKASLENLEEQYQRDAYSSVMSGTVSTEFSPETQERLAKMYEEYTKYAADGSEEAGAKMGALLAEAQAIAANEYNASDGAQLALESNITLAENINKDTAAHDAYWNAGYTMAQKFTEGLIYGMLENGKSISPEEEYGNAPKVMTDLFGEGVGTDWYYNIRDSWKEVKTYLFGGKSHAAGLSYVPYDNYPALLHQGERVLTASENRSHGSGVQVSITGNNFTVHSEDDIERIGDVVANKVARQMHQAFLLAN